MTVNIECHIGSANLRSPIPGAFQNSAQFIHRHFINGSHNVINIQPVSRLANDLLQPQNKLYVNALDLHQCTAALTGNVPGSNRVNKIALILADRYRPNPHVLGVMFDRGMYTQDDPNSSAVFTGTPREGCAIFIEAIRQYRPASADFDREVEFTTIHELGHIFNLPHDETYPNFMWTSRARPFANNFFSFYGSQSQWLKKCDSDLQVHPGGSPFIYTDSSNEISRATSIPLVLNISLPKPTVSTLYPLELDVQLHTASSINRNFYVPNKLDPGYEEFKIWITDNQGNRRRFRSPRRYCASPSRIFINSEKPFSRDISIFEDANGVVFSRPGKYTIEAEFDLGVRGYLTSNALEIDVLDDESLMDSASIEILAQRDVRKFLYFRDYNVGERTFKKVKDFLNDNVSASISNCLRYSLIRAIEKNIVLYDMDDINRHLDNISYNTNPLGIRQSYHLNRIGLDLK